MHQIPVYFLQFSPYSRWYQVKWYIRSRIVTLRKVAKSFKASLASIYGFNIINYSLLMAA